MLVMCVCVSVSVCDSLFHNKVNEKICLMIEFESLLENYFTNIFSFITDFSVSSLLRMNERDFGSTTDKQLK